MNNSIPNNNDSTSAKSLPFVVDPEFKPYVFFVAATLMADTLENATGQSAELCFWGTLKDGIEFWNDMSEEERKTIRRSCLATYSKLGFPYESAEKMKPIESPQSKRRQRRQRKKSAK